MKNSAKINVLFISRDIKSYKQGNYYKEWFDAFSKNERVNITLISFDQINEVENYNLIIFSHSFIDDIQNYLKLTRRFPFKFFPRIKRFRRLIICRNKIIQKLARCESPKIFLSKNDYKLFDIKSSIAKNLKVDLFITHTKKAIEIFSDKLKCEILWIPFSISEHNFKKTTDHKFDLGFRANFNDLYNLGIRKKFFNSLKLLESKYKFDLSGSYNGENFLHGKEYIDWLSSCKLLANTESAFGTVGPKFFEAIACGCVNICPEAEYEGMLYPDIHYVSVKKDFSNLNEKISFFLKDENYRSQIIENSNIILKNNYIENYIDSILNKYF